MILEVKRTGAVAVVTLNRPERRNALSGELIAAITAAFAGLGADPEVRAVVLTGADPVFCAGLDLAEVAGSGANLDAVRNGPFAQLDKPVIAAVNGAAITGGLELALSCDIRIASERALFADTHARVGVMPGWGLTVRLPELIGQPRALEMSLAGARVDAELARDWGLVNRVVAHDELLPTALEMAGRIAELEPRTAGTLLRMYREAADRTRGEALRNELARFSEWSAGLDRSRVPSAAELTGRSTG